MSGMPWFPFWVDDFLSSPKVRVMSMEEVGVYVFLLCEQHQNGYVLWPCERKANAMRTQCDTIQYVLSECFEEAEGRDREWFNPRLARIKTEQLAKSDKAAKAAKARWDKGSKGSDANAMRTHSERNANQNQNHIKKKKASPSKKRSPETQLPDDWEPTNAHLVKAEELGLDALEECEAFVDYHKSKQSLYRDWGRAFHTWLRNAVKFGRAPQLQPEKEDLSHWDEPT